jgi:hypothetical protein
MIHPQKSKLAITAWDPFIQTPGGTDNIKHGHDEEQKTNTFTAGGMGH